MNQKLLYQWIELIQRQFYKLGKWQAMVLAIYSFGVVLAGKCQGSLVAEELGFFSRIPNLERRFRRWLNNPRLDLEICFRLWVEWVWKSLDAPRAILLVDETKLADRLGVMMLSLAYEQRAIPLVWRCYRANSAEDYPQQGQVLMVWGLVARVLEVLPTDSRPLIQMDRGLGHSSAMLKALNSLPIKCQVRLKQNTSFRSRRGHQCLLQDLIKPGEAHTVYGEVFQGKKAVYGRVHLVWELGQAEPWCLYTNDSEVRAAVYALRVWQEESFRDLKSGGWQWQCSYVTSPQHAQRLLLVLSLAYAWMLTQGCMLLHASHDWQREVFEGKDNKYSLFRTGRRWFKRMYQICSAKIYVGLCFIPRFKPRPLKLSSP